MMYIVLDSPFSVGNDFGAVVGVVWGAAVVSSKSFCTFEMLALMALEMSATELSTMVTSMSFFMIALDDPGGDCK